MNFDELNKGLDEELELLDLNILKLEKEVDDILEKFSSMYMCFIIEL